VEKKASKQSVLTGDRCEEEDSVRGRIILKKMKWNYYRGDALFREKYVCLFVGPFDGIILCEEPRREVICISLTFIEGGTLSSIVDLYDKLILLHANGVNG
jgi:hypothetical protein